MRVILDACVPKGLRKSLPDHEIRTAPEMGWGDLDNGDFLDAMKDRYGLPSLEDDSIIETRFYN